MLTRLAARRVRRLCHDRYEDLQTHIRIVRGILGNLVTDADLPDITLHGIQYLFEDPLPPSGESVRAFMHLPPRRSTVDFS